MKNVKKLLREAAKQVEPRADLRESIQSQLPLPCAEHPQKTEKPPRKMKRGYSVLLSAAALCLCGLLMIPLFSRLFPGEPSPSSTILTIDVNPSVALTLDSKNTVVSVEGRNAEAIVILYGMTFSPDLDTALSQILTALGKHGYFAKNKDMRLLSVNRNSRREQELFERAALLSENFFQANNFPCAVVGARTVDKKVLKQHGVTQNQFELALLASDSTGKDPVSLLKLSPADLYKLITGYSDAMNTNISASISERLSQYESQQQEQYGKQRAMLENLLKDLEQIEKILEKIEDGEDSFESLQKSIRQFNDRYASSFPHLTLPETVDEDLLEEIADEAEDCLDELEESYDRGKEQVKDQYLKELNDDDDDDGDDE